MEGSGRNTSSSSSSSVNKTLQHVQQINKHLSLVAMTAPALGREQQPQGRARDGGTPRKTSDPGNYCGAPCYKGLVGDGSSVWREVVLFSEVTNVLSLWGMGCNLRGCPLLRGDKCTITGNKLERLSSFQSIDLEMFH